MRAETKKKIVLFIKGWGVSICVAVLIATSFKSAIAELNHVPTGSMKPTILEGDRIFVNKLAYDLKIPYTTIHLTTWDNPKQGEIIVFKSPADGTRLVKRVIGVPGDQIAMHENHLLINGKPLSYQESDAESFKNLQQTLRNRLFYDEGLNDSHHLVMLTPSKPSLHTFAPMTVPENHYFVMGDNRDNSADSRFFGFVDRDSILGKAPAIVYSLDNSEYFLPRTDRFFKSLT
jgi:signal peptidase I